MASSVMETRPSEYVTSWSILPAFCSHPTLCVSGAVKRPLHAQVGHSLCSNLKLDLIPDWNSVTALPGDTRFHSSGFLDCITVERHQLKANLLIEAKGSCVVIGCDKPDALAPFGTSQIQDRFGKRRANAFASFKGVERHDLAIPVLERVRDKSHGSLRIERNEPGKLVCTMKATACNDFGSAPSLAQERANPVVIVLCYSLYLQSSHLHAQPCIYGFRITSLVSTRMSHTHYGFGDEAGQA